MSESHSRWVEDILVNELHNRDAKWTECIAVGDKGFVQETKEKLGVQAVGRKIEAKDGLYELREALASYNPFKDNVRPGPGQGRCTCSEAYTLVLLTYLTLLYKSCFIDQIVF